MAYTAQADVDAVVRLLLESDLQPATRQMLVDGLPHAISSKSGQRHALQEQFVTLARATLQELQRGAAEKRGALREAIEAAEVHAEEGKTAEEAAGKGEEAAEAAVREKSERHAERQAALAYTRKQLKEAEAARDRTLKAWNQLEGQKSEVSFLIEGPLRMLREGGWEDEESRDSACDSVLQCLAQATAEPSLLAAAKAALACRPEKRTEFDLMTVTCVTEVLQEKANGLEQQMQANKLEKDDVVAEALGLMALASREGEEESSAHTDLLLARAAVQESIATRKEATAELKTRNQAVSQKLASQVLEEERAKLIDATLEAAERLVAFAYGPAAGEAADPGC